MYKIDSNTRFFPTEIPLIHQRREAVCSPHLIGQNTKSSFSRNDEWSVLLLLPADEIYVVIPDDRVM